MHGDGAAVVAEVLAQRDQVPHVQTRPRGAPDAQRPAAADGVEEPRLQRGVLRVADPRPARVVARRRPHEVAAVVARREARDGVRDDGHRRGARGDVAALLGPALAPQRVHELALEGQGQAQDAPHDAAAPLRPVVAARRAIK